MLTLADSIDDQKQSSIVILGNGPSLRNFDFHSLRQVDTLGMNAAYRYWERISWYPDHYACIDDQLIETHHDAIYKLIDKEYVRTAFLKESILDYFPDLSQRDNVYFLGNFQVDIWEQISKKYNIRFIHAKSFKESDPSKVTTGAYSIRYAAFLGYVQIALLGIDLKYKEIIPEASYRGGSRLEIVETPKKNANYFFDDYQRKGDKYNIPNPPFYNENLHVRSFELVANDMIEFEWNPIVFNSNRSSVLYEDKIFPFIEISYFLGKFEYSQPDVAFDETLSSYVSPPNQGSLENEKTVYTVWETASTSIGDTAKRDFAVGFCLEANQETTITITFGSCDSLQIEREESCITLTPGISKRIVLRKTFLKSHSLLSIDIALSEKDGTSSPVKSGSVFFLETLTSICRRLSTEEVSLALGNNLVRKGDYAAALTIYLWLYQTCQLGIYKNNALLAARRLRMQPVESLESDWLEEYMFLFDAIQNTK